MNTNIIVSSTSKIKHNRFIVKYTSNNNNNIVSGFATTNEALSAALSRNIYA